MAYGAKTEPLGNRLELRCNSVRVVRKGERQRKKRLGERNVGDVNTGSAGSKRWVAWQGKGDSEGGGVRLEHAPVSLTGMEVKCSFMWRQPREQGMEIKGKTEGGTMMTLNISKGHICYQIGRRRSTVERRTLGSKSLLVGRLQAKRLGVNVTSLSGRFLWKRDDVLWAAQCTAERSGNVLHAACNTCFSEQAQKATRHRDSVRVFVWRKT